MHIFFLILVYGTATYILSLNNNNNCVNVNWFSYILWVVYLCVLCYIYIWHTICGWYSFGDTRILEIGNNVFTNYCSVECGCFFANILQVYSIMINIYFWTVITFLIFAEDGVYKLTDKWGILLCITKVFCTASLWVCN